MENLYGLTDCQMWVVYEECKRHNWREEVETIAADSFYDHKFTAFEIEEAVTNAMRMYTRYYSDAQDQNMHHLAFCAVLDIYDRVIEQQEE